MDKELLKTILLDERTLKGIELYQEGCVTSVGFNQWKVSSLEKTYNITYSKGKWTCTCPDYQYRNNKCKHIHAARLHCKYSTSTAPKLTFNEMVELEKTRIDSMKTVLVG